MSDLLALDVAILPPPDIQDRAIRLSAGLPDAGFEEGLRLDDTRRPHVTLTQQFVRRSDMDRIVDRLDAVLAGQPPLRLHVTGAAKTGASTVWIAIERTDALASLHARLMEALGAFEHAAGSAASFVDAGARAADVAWVAGYRLQSSFQAYTPHITLGHGSDPPQLEPFTFDATTVAACHLGRFCTCRRVLRRWELVRSA